MLGDDDRQRIGRQRVVVQRQSRDIGIIAGQVDRRLHRAGVLDDRDVLAGPKAGALGLEQAGVERRVVPGRPAGRRARAGRHPEGVGLADLVEVGIGDGERHRLGRGRGDGRVPVKGQVVGARAADGIGVGEAGGAPASRYRCRWPSRGPGRAGRRCRRAWRVAGKPGTMTEPSL